jgi:hypothetical protein
MGTLEEVDLRKAGWTKDNMRIKRVSVEMTSDRREWKRMEEENMLCRRHLVGEGDEDDDDDNK